MTPICSRREAVRGLECWRKRGEGAKRRPLVTGASPREEEEEEEGKRASDRERTRAGGNEDGGRDGTGGETEDLTPNFSC